MARAFVELQERSKSASMPKKQRIKITHSSLTSESAHQAVYGPYSGFRSAHPPTLGNPSAKIVRATPQAKIHDPISHDETGPVVVGKRKQTSGDY